MWNKIMAFFMSIIAFFAGLFGIDFEPKSDYVFKDLSYGTHERQVLDLRLPENSDGEVGLVLSIHGGAWIGGEKDVYKDNLKSICNDLGYAAAAINYRYLSEDVTLHDIADDIQAALGVIKQKGAEKGITINKVLLTGASAGAHLSMFYAYARADVSPIKPAAVVSYCGPTDLTDENYYINNDLGDPETVANLFSMACGKTFTFNQRHTATEELKAVSPLYYVNESTVPTVICHGQKDTIVPYTNATAIIEKFDRYGVKYDFVSYPNSGHGLDNDPAEQERANELIFEYARTYLGTEK